jgi:hypothetical protein
MGKEQNKPKKGIGRIGKEREARKVVLLESEGQNPQCSS